MSPASRVANHGSMVWLWTGVSSGNRPMFGTKNTENTARALEGPCVDRVPRGVPLWSGMGKPGDLGDHPADKISACSDQGPEIRGDLSAGSLGLLCASTYGLFLDAILLYAPSGPLCDL